MAAIVVTTTPQIVYTSRQGAQFRQDTVKIRITAGTGTVYLELGKDASATTSFFVTGAEVYEHVLTSGEFISAVVASGTVAIRVSGAITGKYGPADWTG